MAASLHERALRCLALREHSRAELARKLGSLGDADEVNAELDRLTELGLLSDARFADAYVRAKAARFGAARLRLELGRKGVSAELIAASLEDNCSSGELDRTGGRAPAATALSTSSRPQEATRAISLPVAGLTVGIVSPERAGANVPPIKASVG